MVLDFDCFMSVRYLKIWYKSAMSKDFGNLVIMKTAGYACKKFYWALHEIRDRLV